MKKIVVLYSIALLSGLFTLFSCQEKKQLYLQLYSLRDDIKADYAGTIAKVAEMGFTGVEAAGYNDGMFYGMAPAEYKKSIEAVGMKALSSHAGRPLADSVSNTNWEEIWTWWDTAIQAHKEAGMKFIIMPWIPAPKTMADLQAYCDYFNRIGEKCQAAGLNFGYHNHNFEFNEVEGEMMYDYMLQHTDPEKVFFQMDVYWVVRGRQDPVAYFKKYPGRFKLLHIKDETEVGRDGVVDFENVFNEASTAGAQYMVVEVEKYTGTPLEGVRQSYDFLDNADFVKKSYSK